LRYPALAENHGISCTPGRITAEFFDSWPKIRAQIIEIRGRISQSADIYGKTWEKFLPISHYYILCRIFQSSQIKALDRKIHRKIRTS